MIIVAGLLIALDQVTKLWVAHSFPLGGPGEPLFLGFHITHVRNTGAAFGILQDGTLFLAILSAVVATGIFAYLLAKRQELPALQKLALVLVFSGAVGNMIDRFAYGYVIDFIHFRVGSFDFPVFNVADSCVVVGAALLILSSFRHPAKRAAKEGELGEPDFFNRVD